MFLIMHLGHDGTVFLIFRNRVLFVAVELLTTCSFDDVSVSCRMNVLARGIEYLFTHELSNFTVFPSLTSN